ncbi:MAG: succinylglutamate desuccinylase/aspartoacylase family protein [Planctomycetaceae bacterium]
MAPFLIGGVDIAPGETRDVRVKISETYTNDPIEMPIRVIRSLRKGPVGFVSAALHGDELTGTGIIHELLHNNSLQLVKGTLLLIPVVNVFGFENHDRYLPDRRDLNRMFPGSETGSLASRIADRFMKEVVSKCEFGIDLHSAASTRTNFPNVRGDMSIRKVARLAKSFGCELVVDGAGPDGCMRREACKVGCATIILEAGEPMKAEPGMLAVGVRGVRNSLIDMGMIEGERFAPPYQAVVRKTSWVRAEVGGFLRFHIAPGAFVERGQAVASNFTILGDVQNILTSPVDGIVLGMTTSPAVKPGEPVCHIAIPEGNLTNVRKMVESVSRKDPQQRVRTKMAADFSHGEPTVLQQRIPDEYGEIP